jgi:hypothetical protein
MSRRILAAFAAILVSTIALASNNAVCTVQNDTSYDLGLVTLAGTSCSTSLAVSGAGLFTGSTQCSITTATVNGQTVTYPNSGIVNLSSGARVKVEWTALNYVEVVDGLLQNSPAQ